MRFLEERIPELADGAIKQAYLRALASGNSVLECEQGIITQILPDGTRKIIKRLPKPIKVAIGQRLKI